jgi:3-hydroxyisobutyrate dehydrogenase-like beta-hydroxyacid dehydrogenase
MPRRNSKNVGLIGLGIIGQRVAESLRRHGFHVFVWNRTPRPVPNFLGSPAAVAELCDFVQIFVADDDALLEVVRQMAPKLTAQHIVAAHSTVAPDSMRMAAALVQRRGARFLDAPFTGSKMAAAKGELVYYVAGDDGALEQVRKLLEASSKEIVEIGEIGQATTIKIATNIVTAATVQAGAEALALVAKSGIAPEKLLAAFESNSVHSATLAMKLPKIMKGDFEPHFSVKHMLKDVQLAGKMARALELDLAINETLRDALIDEVKKGRADDDYSSIAHRYLPEGVSGCMPSEPVVQPDLIADYPISDDSQPAETPVGEFPSFEIREEAAGARETNEREAVSGELQSSDEEATTKESFPPPPSESPKEESPRQEVNVADSPAAEPSEEKEEPEARRSLWSRLISRGGDY